jgi:hypothetical protein
MARADLSTMLGKLGDDEMPQVEEPQLSFSSIVTAVAPTKPARAAKKAAPAGLKDRGQPSAAEPLYLRLERKEARLRADQYKALTEHARRLNRAKGTGGERITENTLIRVAIDLLLSHVDQVTGVNEAELRKSVSL